MNDSAAAAKARWGKREGAEDQPTEGKAAPEQHVVGAVKVSCPTCGAALSVVIYHGAD